MATAGDVINGSLRLLGVLAEGETPSAAMSQDALSAMNQMLESWSTERLAVFATQDQVKTWPANQRTRTLGPSGNIVGLRPVLLDDATYFKDPSTDLSFPIRFINEEQYNGIALKTSTSTYPQVMHVNMGSPNIEMSVFPVPTMSLEFHFISVEELAQPASLATALTFPPGYLRAFRYNLATEFAAEFGVEPSPQVQRIAMASKRNLKRINNSGDMLSIPYDMAARQGQYNIFTG